jgi:hypothetical protein
MANELDRYRRILHDGRSPCHPLATEARVALSEPDPERLTDEELSEPLGDLIDKWCQEGMQVKPHGTSFPVAHYVASKAFQYGLCKGRSAPEGPFSLIELATQWNAQADEFNQWDSLGLGEQIGWAQARAIAADRARRSAPEPPADGEVATIAARLKELAHAVTEERWCEFSMRVPAQPLRDADLVLTRAADLLSRLSPPQPIPVSERLPGPEDCDAAGMCWWWCFPAERWLRCGIPKPDPTSQIHTHWLPAHALPLPSKEDA